MKHKKIIVWFRNDLRLKDNVTLQRAAELGEEVIPVYCFDPRHFQETPWGFQKTGHHRARFLLETVADLKSRIDSLGGQLVIFSGLPEVEVVELALEQKADAIFFSQEVTAEELNVEEQLEKNAWSKGIATESFWQSTLYHLDDLNFPVQQLPDVFTNFRKSCEKMSQVRPTVSAEVNFANLQAGPIQYLSRIPSLKQLGFTEEKKIDDTEIKFIGGESAAEERLNHYFWDTGALSQYKKTRNELLGMDYSSKFSPWLSIGALSPRQVYWEVLRYEKERGKNQSTYWLIFELIWRDFFRFVAKKYGSLIFQVDGIQKKSTYWGKDMEKFNLWDQGQTGVPFVDANMRELNATGYMSNRGRQIVASFLVNDLNTDWRWGAAYFEQQLVDYDVCSNWSNWMYIAGVGNDPRQDRYFNILLQAKKYDPKGDYVRHWIHELAELTNFDAHQPFHLDQETLKKAKIKLGKQYPSPMVSFENWSV